MEQRLSSRCYTSISSRFILFWTELAGRTILSDVIIIYYIFIMVILYKYEYVFIISLSDYDRSPRSLACKGHTANCQRCIPSHERTEIGELTGLLEYSVTAHLF